MYPKGLKWGFRTLGSVFLGGLQGPPGAAGPRDELGDTEVLQCPPPPWGTTVAEPLVPHQTRAGGDRHHPWGHPGPGDGPGQPPVGQGWGGHRAISVPAPAMEG